MPSMAGPEVSATPRPWARVLVLDDEAPVRDLWVEALHEAGYDAMGVARGDDAIGRRAEFAPDLILLDMMMPHMDGFEFLARLRAHSPAAQTPLLIVSALGESLGHALDAQGSRILGIAGILMKPVDVAVLLGAVRRIIGPGARHVRDDRHGQSFGERPFR